MSCCCIGISTLGPLAAFSVAWEVSFLKGGGLLKNQKQSFATALPMPASSPSSPSPWSATWQSAIPSTCCPSPTWAGSPLSLLSAGLPPCLPAFPTSFSPSSQITFRFHLSISFIIIIVNLHFEIFIVVQLYSKLLWRWHCMNKFSFRPAIGPLGKFKIVPSK